jgi:hypothetical protein
MSATFQSSLVEFRAIFERLSSDAGARAHSAAQVTIIEAVLGAGAQIFNAGGASAIRETTSLDRHWRNARTLASHNPVIYKPRVIGDFIVNGTTARSSYDRASTAIPAPEPATT